FARMELALSAPQIVPEPLRRGPPLPLSQLVEESRSTANIPNHLLESKIYAKLKSNTLIQAEPPVLHFSGFELGKDYVKILVRKILFNVLGSNSLYATVDAAFLFSLHLNRLTLLTQTTLRNNSYLL
uniref:Uncharacterized protein n=1 Tax=Sander lucioperca TaxID=283035 RepID=A0A8D0AVZ8_SANLU